LIHPSKLKSLAHLIVKNVVFMNNKCNALVTASSRGIGFQAALALAEKGCNVAINSRNQKNLEAAARKLRGFVGNKVGVEEIKGDMSKHDDVKKLYAEAVKKLGGLDVIVMSYGNPPCEPCELIDTGYEDWSYAFNLYISSTMEMMKSAYLYGTSKTSFVIISSFSAYHPMGPTSLSDIIRGSLPALVKTYSRLYPEKIRANLLVLGSFKTEGATSLIKKLSEEEGVDEATYWKEFVEGISPLRRAGRFEELREVISWLAFAPEYLTGSVIVFDGGTLNCIL